ERWSCRQRQSPCQCEDLQFHRNSPLKSCWVDLRGQRPAEAASETTYVGARPCTAAHDSHLTHATEMGIFRIFVPCRACAFHEWRSLAIREQDCGAASRAKHAVLK